MKLLLKLLQVIHVLLFFAGVYVLCMDPSASVWMFVLGQPVNVYCMVRNARILRGLKL